MLFTEELLGFPGITVNNYQIEHDKVTLKLGYFNDESSCPFRLSGNRGVKCYY